MLTKFEDLPVILRVNDVAEVLGISKSATYGLFRRQGFPVISIGRRKVVPRDALVRWIEGQVNAAAIA